MERVLENMCRANDLILKAAQMHLSVGVSVASYRHDGGNFLFDKLRFVSSVELRNVVMEAPLQIPDDITHIFGVHEPGTRIHRKEGGTEEENSLWFDAVCAVAGPVVSPGGACMYAPVSRAAVHQRIKDGKLTAFLFHVVRKRRNWLGRPRESRRSAFIYIPVCELKAWAEEIKARAVKQGNVTREEIEGAEPDWKGDFLEWRNKKERETFFDIMKDHGVPASDAVKKNEEDYNRRVEALEKDFEEGGLNIGRND